MINKELFEGPVGDYCIARNTIKCLFCLPGEANKGVSLGPNEDDVLPVLSGPHGLL